MNIEVKIRVSARAFGTTTNRRLVHLNLHLRPALNELVNKNQGIFFGIQVVIFPVSQ